MDGSRFDAFTRVLSQSGSRRNALKMLLGFGGVAAVGAIVFDDVDAARRGEPASPPTPNSNPTSAPSIPTSEGRRATKTPIPTPSCPGVVCSDGCCDGACTSTGVCCPAGSTVCGPDCCPNGQAQCCDNACCYGTCYGEELCCATGQPVCTVDGCCDGACTDNNQFCCSPDGICGDECCNLVNERCCTDDSGGSSCIPADGCCSDTDCPGARCQNGFCVPFTPTNAATSTETVAPTNTPDPTATASNTPSATSTSTETATVTPTSTATDTPTSTSTPTDTPTSTPTHTATATPTETATSSATPTPPASATPTATPTASDTPTATPTEMVYVGRISTASSGLSGGDCVVSATASDFKPLAAIEFSLWGEGGPDPDGAVGTIPTTTDGTGSASMQYAVDPHAHREIVITASQTLSAAQTQIALNCPDPTPVPPEVIITFTPYPGEPDFCQAIVTLTGFAPNTSAYLEIRVLNGMTVFGDNVSTDSSGAASYTVPFAVSTADDENIEAVVQDFSTGGIASSGVVSIDC